MSVVACNHQCLKSGKTYFKSRVKEKISKNRCLAGCSIGTHVQEAVVQRVHGLSVKDILNALYPYLI